VRWANSRLPPRADGGSDPASVPRNPFVLQLVAHDKNNLVDNILVRTPENLRAWTKVQELLTAIRDRSTALGAQLVMVIFPHTLQVSPSHFDFYKRLGFTMPEDVLLSRAPQDLFLAYCRAHDVPCFDALPLLKAHADDELFLDRDEHMNRAGNLLAEGQLVEFLLRNTTIGR